MSSRRNTFRDVFNRRLDFGKLGLSPSNGENFLTPPISNGFFPEGSNGAQKSNRLNHFSSLFE